MGYKEIPLTQDKVTLVDIENYDYLNQWKWFADKDRKNSIFMVYNEPRCPECKGKTIKIDSWMERQNETNNSSHYSNNKSSCNFPCD